MRHRETLKYGFDADFELAWCDPLGALGRDEAVGNVLNPNSPLGDNWRKEGLDSRINATFQLLEKVTLTPEAVTASDISSVRAAGVSEGAITDALYICFLFGTINRIANTFDFGWKTDVDRMKLAVGLNRIRYHVPDFLLR